MSKDREWYTSGVDGRDCATGDEYHHGYEVHARAADAATAEMICAAVNTLRQPPVSSASLIDDQPCTPMPTHCESWVCHRGEDRAVLVERAGFMVCSRCMSSWGAAHPPPRKNMR